MSGNSGTSGNKRRRKSTGAVIYVPVAVFFILFLAVLGTSSFLKVLEIEVLGSTMYTDDDIIAASGITPGKNLLFMNLSTAKDRIFFNMPYINGIVITRVLPARIRIDVSESEAIALIAYRDERLIIDSAGRILERVGEVVPDLPEVLGFTPVEPVIGSVMKAEIGDETRLQYLTEVLAAVERDENRGDVSFIDVGSIANITLGYAGRFRVVLGSSTGVSHKLSQLPGIVAEIDRDLSREATGSINMSNTAGTWRFNPDW